MRKSSSGSPLRLAALAAAVLGIVLIAVAAVLWLRPAPPSGSSATGQGGSAAVVKLGPGAAIGGSFTLVDHTGTTVSSDAFAGRFMLIYFGFTHCPDVCPTELQTMANTMDALGDDATRVVPIFITIDPQRDTPGQLKDYVAAFDPAMVGLTGSPDQIAAVAKLFKVYYSKAPGGTDTDYQVDHTSFIYLMGPDGVIRSLFRAGASDEAMAAEIRAQLRASAG